MRIFSFIAALFCLLALSGCGDRGGEQAQAPAPVAVETGGETADEQPLPADAGEIDAVEAIPRYTLTYTAGANGSIKGAVSQTVAEGGDGSPVTAVADAGHHFTGWSDGVATPGRTDRKVTSDLAATASFAVNQYTLTYTAEKNGSIDGASPQTVQHGADGSPVTAVAARGHHFTGWSDGVATARRADTGVGGDITARAAFAVNTHRVGGTLSGLAPGNRLTLQNNGGDDLVVAANGGFTFATAVPFGSPYGIRVLAQSLSPNQACTVTGGSGTVSDTDVMDIKVECRLNTYTIGGTVAGLPDGGQVVLRNNNGDDLTVGANGKFVFSRALPDGGAYRVSIHSRRLKPKWSCEVENASGSLAGSDVSNVAVFCFPELEIQARAGDRKIDLHWNSKDFSGVSFNLCLAREGIPADGFGRCSGLKGGALRTKVDSPQALSKLINDATYWLQVEALHANGRRTYSRSVSATPFGGLNDTGLDWCADDTTNLRMDGTRTDKAAGCEKAAATHPGQDAHLGRDAAAGARKLAKTGSGRAGFDFTRICGNGEAAGEGKCPPNPTFGSGANNWACTRDNVTGLVWEVKTESGLRSRSNTYTWYNPDGTANGGDAGGQNGGACAGSGCDTDAFVKAVNAQGLCGGKDWRLPTRKELLSIVDNGRLKPAIDTGSFPNSPADYYWTSSTYADQANSAWQVNFLYGEASPGSKKQGGQVRLVRPAQ